MEWWEYIYWYIIYISCTYALPFSMLWKLKYKENSAGSTLAAGRPAGATRPRCGGTVLCHDRRGRADAIPYWLAAGVCAFN